MSIVVALKNIKQSWGSTKIRLRNSLQLSSYCPRCCEWTPAGRNSPVGPGSSSESRGDCQVITQVESSDVSSLQILFDAKYSNEQTSRICFHQATSIASIFTVTDAPSLCHRTLIFTAGFRWFKCILVKVLMHRKKNENGGNSFNAGYFASQDALIKSYNLYFVLWLSGRESCELP